MPEFTIARAFIELGVRGESAVRERLEQARAGAQRGGGGAGAVAALGGPVGVAITAANQFFEIVGKVSSVIQGLFSKAIGLAAVANPVAMERYEYAQRDLAAVMGRVFVPILEKATEVVRFFADVLNAILPSTNEVREAFKGFDPVFAQLKQIAADLAPLFKSFINYHLKQMAVAIQVVATTIEQLIEIAKRMPGAELLFRGGGGALPSSHGAGDFRTPSMTGIAEAKNAFMIEALRVSAGERKDEPTGSEQKRQTQLLERMASGANVGSMLGGMVPGGSGAGAITGAVLGVLGY